MKKMIAILLLVTLLVAAMPTAALAASKTRVYRVNTKASPLMVHSAPDGKKASRIGYLAKNAAVTVLKKSGNWYRIKSMGGMTGWVYASYLKAGTYAWINTRKNGLNIHRGMNLNKNTIIGSAPKGAQVLVQYISGSLANIVYKNLNGWSSKNYLRWIG